MLGNTGFEVIFCFSNIGGITIRGGAWDTIYYIGAVLNWNGIFKICKKERKFIVGFETKA